VLLADSQPRNVQYRKRTLPDLLERGAELFGERPMFECGSVRRGFGEVRGRAASLGGALRDAGLGASDRVAIMCRNRPESLQPDAPFSIGLVELDEGATMVARTLPVFARHQGGPEG
jgi:long-subunit acyl-CoA synthetase (AMP-forming)